MKILVVEDSKDFLFLIESLLKFHKIDVTGVDTADAALSILEKGRYDLLVSDYMIEDGEGKVPMNGLELSEEAIKKDHNLKGRIIVVSSKTFDDSELEKANELEINYLKKPILPNEFYNMILEVLEKNGLSIN